MTKTFTVLWSLGFFGALALATPGWSHAQENTWAQGQTSLEEHLPAGKTTNFYRSMLTDLGYLITSVNYNEPDYAEYEIVKGDRTYEIQIDLHEDTGRATNVNVTGNLWQADFTEWALNRPDWTATASPDDPEYIFIVMRDYHFSDRDRLELRETMQELEALPVGRNNQFYRRALQRRGYEITDTVSTPDRTQFEVTKNGDILELTVQFNDETGESTEISVSPLAGTGQKGPTKRHKARQQKTQSPEESSPGARGGAS